VWVSELSDDAAPRVRTDKPNLYVGLTIEDPRTRFDRLMAGVRPNHPVRLYGVELRSDLYEHLPTYTDLRIATEAKRKLIKDLRHQGFVVNRIGHRYCIYVILLRDVGLRKHPDKPWVYVGQTAKNIEERFREHIEGAREIDATDRQAPGAAFHADKRIGASPFGGQSEAEATEAVIPGGSALFEGQEDPLQGGRVNADTGIADLDPQVRCAY